MGEVPGVAWDQEGWGWSVSGYAVLPDVTWSFTDLHHMLPALSLDELEGKPKQGA